ncbi:DUF4845 domain-containing protein [Legionella impletisoli]|uniref:DUF4845 domain-containing protein n=1 Tax=Legionella impletisoli TaxID=343510 RepID=A0A917NBT5_9GAMM|nr:DUF4845 domain-containing protein [Legionella impletisoli]GGI85370.1 DUF4845 domain-containing protein [Legionella impletisoli]
MNKQSGMSFIGMVFTMAVVIIVLVTSMRIVPVYIQHYTVIKSIETLDKIPKTEFSGDPMTNAHVLRQKLTNQLYVNGVEIPEDKILIKPSGEGQYTVAITYKVTKSLVGNMSLLFDFDVSREVTIGRD